MSAPGFGHPVQVCRLFYAPFRWILDRAAFAVVRALVTVHCGIGLGEERAFAGFVEPGGAEIGGGLGWGEYLQEVFPHHCSMGNESQRG